MANVSGCSGPAARDPRMNGGGTAGGNGRRGRRPRCRLHIAALTTMLALATAPRPASAQVLSASLGFTGGLIGGAYITTAVYVLRSRTGGYILNSPHELISARPEGLPLVIAPVAGAVLGYRDADRLKAAGTWGAVGLVGGAAVGAGIGTLIWGDSEGRWAGGTIGSALGLIIGAVAGAAAEQGEPEDATSAAARWLTVSIPIGGGR